MEKVRRGKIVEGTVILVSDEECYVDIGAFADGVVYKDHLSLESIESCHDVVSEGDTLTFKVTDIANDDEEQRILLSRLAVIHHEKRKEFNDFLEENEVFEAKVIKSNKGGLILKKQGVEMFMPMSHIDFKRVQAKDFIGKTLKCTVLENEGRNLVVSRKNVLRQLHKEEKKEELDEMNVGDVLEGSIVRVLDFGAFVRFERVEGLLHKSEISHYRVNDARDVLKKGEKVQVKVISREKNKVGLSAKRLKPSPWDKFAKEHNVGDKVEGKIVKKMANAMLLEIEKEVVGIINKRDYSWDPNHNLAGDVEEGDSLEVKILNMNPKRERMTLSKKHLEYNPWNDVSVKVGEETSGVVKELRENGAIVEVQGVEAFLPIGEIKDEHVSDVKAELTVEDAIKVLVKDLDKKNWKMIVSIKALKQRKEKETFKKFKKDEKQAQKQTLGDLFKDKFKELKD